MTSPSRIQNDQSPSTGMNGEKDDQPGAEDGSSSPRGGPRNSRHPVAEFLYQLTKMLTDDNSEVIEWSTGRIKVHHPDRLEADVLHKYFRHSKFASFQRQLNYFGFRKIAGKGKMAPCSYVNDAASEDIRSLLLIKRKTNGSAARKAMGGHRGVAQRNLAGGEVKLTMPDNAVRGVYSDRYASGMIQPQIHVPSRPAELQNASALFHGGAMRSGLSQQQLQRKALSETLYFPSENTLAALAAGQNRQAISEMARLSNLPQYNGQLGGIAGLRDQAATAAALNLATSAARPATAAMNAALAAGQNSSNPFESSQLNSFVNENAGGPAAASPAATLPGDSQVARRVSSQNILNRLPSSNTIFPDSLSSVSLSNLLGPNRVSSLLSLGSFLSRDPSLVDLMGQSGVPQYPLGVSAGLGVEPTPVQKANQPHRPGNGHK